MNLIDNLNRVLDNVHEMAGGIPTIKRFIKSSRRQFRPKSPNDVDRLTYLATLLCVAGDQSSAESIFDFLDKYTGEYKDGRRDLAVELAMSRLVWVHLLRNRGEEQLFRRLLARPDIGASSNLDNVAPPDLDILVRRSKHPKYKNYIVGDHLVSDILLDIELQTLAEESCADNTRGDKLRSCYHGFLDLVIIRERSEEIRDKISEKDEMLLDEAISMYREKMAKYI